MQKRGDWQKCCAIGFGIYFEGERPSHVFPENYIAWLFNAENFFATMSQWLREGEMENFKVVMKTDQKHCPLKHRPYLAPVSDTKCTELLDCETGQFLPCSAKNCPYKEGKNEKQ
jgi:hypothetical protein